MIPDWMPLPRSWVQLPRYLTDEDLEDGVPPCEECDAEVEGVYVCDDDLLCEPCAAALTAEIAEEAWEFALANCRLTGPLPPYGRRREYKCTPEEYEDGLKDTNSEAAYAAHCRHKRSNYDELIRDLDRDGHRDCLRYGAIRERVCHLIWVEWVWADEDEDEDEDEGAGSEED